MKAWIKSSIGLSLFSVLMSFTWTNGNSKKIHDSDKIVSETTASGDEVIITYEKPDVCNLNYLGEIKATEKFLFFNNNGLKSNTIAELKKQASDIGGSIVYVYTDLQNGFAIGFTRIVSACVFKK
jgi:hypothetical protein